MDAQEVSACYQVAADCFDVIEHRPFYQALADAYRNEAGREVTDSLEDAAYSAGCTQLYQVGFDIDGNAA